MFVDALLALGMLLTTAVPASAWQLPLGPGEMCLVLWFFIMLLREVGRLGPPLTPALSRLLAFWTIFVMSLCLGFLTGLFIGQLYDMHWVLHDVMAYPLLAAVSCMSIVDPGARQRLRRVAWLMITFGTACLALQVAAGWKIVDIPLVQPWYWERFRGWSAIPNQLSLLCVVLALLSVHLAETAAGWSGRIVALVCSILPICVGRMTMSDTFTLALVASVPVFLSLKIWLWLRSWKPGQPMRFAFACTLVFGLPLLLISLAPLVDAASDAGIFAKELAKNGGKELREESDLRFSLWAQALQVGINTVNVGLGPGPHLEIPASIVAGRMGENGPGNIEHPEQSSAPNFEAHNTFLDLLTQGGLIAVLSFVWILGVSAFTAYKTGLAGLTTLIFGRQLILHDRLNSPASAFLVRGRPLPGRGG